MTKGPGTGCSITEFGDKLTSMVRSVLLKFTLTILFLTGLVVAAEARPEFSAITVDARTGKVLFADNPDGARHPASLTKMMTLYVLFQD